jgi:hypothetical protein
MANRSCVCVAGLGLALTLGSGTSFAQSTCGTPREVAGVGTPQAVSTFMSGVDQGDGRLRIGRVSYLNYLDLASRLKTAGLAGYQGGDVRVASSRSAEQRVAAGFVGASYFDVLDVPLQLGKGFASSADVPGKAPRAAVLGDALWTSMFERNPSAIGQTITVNGHEVVVTGIAAAPFQGVIRPNEALWLPGAILPIVNEQPGLRADDRASGGYYYFFVRPAAGASWTDVQQELTAATSWLLERYPAENGKFTEVSFHDYGPITCASR